MKKFIDLGWEKKVKIFFILAKTLDFELLVMNTRDKEGKKYYLIVPHDFKDDRLPTRFHCEDMLSILDGETFRTISTTAVPYFSQEIKENADVPGFKERIEDYFKFQVCEVNRLKEELIEKSQEIQNSLTKQSEEKNFIERVLQ